MAAKISKYVKSPSYRTKMGNEKWLENVVGNIGPVAVSIHVSENFKHYSTGNQKENLFFELNLFQNIKLLI